MKKLFLSLASLLILFTANAQISTDTYTVNQKDGTSKSVKITDLPVISFFDSGNKFGSQSLTFGNTISMNSVLTILAMLSSTYITKVMSATLLSLMQPHQTTLSDFINISNLITEARFCLQLWLM